MSFYLQLQPLLHKHGSTGRDFTSNNDQVDMVLTSLFSRCFSRSRPTVWNDSVATGKKQRKENEMYLFDLQVVQEELLRRTVDRKGPVRSDSRKSNVER